MAGAELQSEDHRTLLDIVDRLRLTGITRYIDLPQIVVCGDQSAGKSSVLEAISGLRFPTKDNLCTRFATELVLRCNETVGVKVSIIPGSDRKPEECRNLSQFNHKIDLVDPDLSGLIEQAKQAMGLSDTKVFSSDVLRVDFEGPEQPHLTLVDLPGLFRAGNREQSVDEAPIVHEMVRSYMEKPRSIILAVGSAKSDLALQEVTKYSLELDPHGVRTLRLITKPDTLSRGSESETAYITMAHNKDVVFRLGWHVLKNRSFETRDVSTAVRDLQESQFFAAGAWASLNPSTVGIQSLRPRLSNILRNQILENLPSLHADVVLGIEECKARLEQLAVDGAYSDSFFGHARTKQGQQKRLRAIVQNRPEDFAEDMRVRGHNRVIVEDDEESDSDHHHIERIRRAEYIASVKELMRHSRGTELPGTFNPEIIGDLFREQCQPWRGLVAEVHRDIMQCVRWTAKAVLEAVAVTDTVDALFTFIDRAIDRLGCEVERKVDEMLRPHLAGHPIIYNHYLISNVQKVQANRRKRGLERAISQKFMFNGNFQLDESDIKNLIQIVQEHEEVDMGYYASQLAVDYLQAYYKVALKNWVDDVSIHVIEEQLIQKLPLVFDHRTVEQLTDADVNHLTAEKSKNASDRAHALEKLDSLTKASKELESLGKHRLKTHASIHLAQDRKSNSTVGENDTSPSPLKSQSPSPISEAAEQDEHAEAMELPATTPVQNGFGEASASPLKSKKKRSPKIKKDLGFNWG
ncbi:hypothetical protein CKM354_001124200 [Cercospora kikuchii]|uniref:Interferon-induced GTP-binding protein Mx n=1 Tax=Cercospora kikuchii TaxID=84275 RepID=A0A9P3CSL9_9PEZI|nr:uncharacterized protein CKM354_001124200 [Cercospora kikuchii]GIZ48169.1 hypothetical protein CKM354_001124200 [Cercospora kikuchii]